MKIYTDGSAYPNPGRGGFSIIVCDNNDNILITISHQAQQVSNNQMELAAILSAVLLYGNKGIDLTIYSDSAYAINCLDFWRFSWERNGWRKSDNQVPENLEIIKEYKNLIDSGYKAKLVKVKGHSTCCGNQLADLIASGKQKAEVII